MRYLAFILTLTILCSCIHWNKIASQKPIKSIDHSKKIVESNYTEVAGDPLKVREYTLDNGLKVFISPNKSEPRIQTLVLVKAGSINDPADATGLAHYLEHMLFKGNNNFGTVDYEKEKVEIDKIKYLFKDLKASQDSAKRKLIYHQIDSISGVAAQYACPNEIDQLFTQIGAKGTNAYTSKEFTGYINNIPSNQLENWLSIESERYNNPVLRLFHTELEAVYEEKNMALDKADRRMNEEFLRIMYPNHNYGKQTNIGTIEHLKSPSMFAIDEFFETYYVPNNMAVFLAGDVNPDSAFALVKSKFSHFKKKVVPPYLFDNQHKITKPEIVHISSKEAERLMIGYRFPGAGTKESYLVEMVDMLLHNRNAGLFDLNINQAQKAIDASSYPYILKDYSGHEMEGQPNKGESLEDLHKLLISQIDLLKKGDFNEWLMTAVVNDLKKEEIMSARSNNHRVSLMSRAFSKNIPWEVENNHFERLSKITKQEIIDFVNANYNDNYVAVYRHQSDTVKNVQVEKPAITPIEIPKGNRSEFLLNFSKQSPPSVIEPVFVKYENELITSALDSSRTLYYQHNSQDSLFALTFVMPIGRNHNSNLSFAFQYAELCGSKNLPVALLSEKWYKLGIEFKMSVGAEESFISLSGLSSNMTSGIELMKKRILNVVGDTVQLESLKEKIVQLRENSVTNKRHILRAGLKNFLIYDKNSAHMNSLSNEELRGKKTEELLSTFTSSISQIKEVYYYGPLSNDYIKSIVPEVNQPNSNHFELNQYAKVSAKDTNEIYFFDFKMQQAEILLMHKGKQFSKEQLPYATLLNEYFGFGMGSIVFQELREKKALAYSVYVDFRGPSKKVDPNYTVAYIGTQADKYEEAISEILKLLEKLPKDSLKFAHAKESIKQKYASNRIAEHAMLGAYRTDKKMGYNYDKRRDTYEKIESITFDDFNTFFNDNIKGKKYRIAVLGDVDKIDLNKLGNYGTVRELQFNDVFPY